VSGRQAFEIMVALSTQTDQLKHPVPTEDYEQWRRDYIWEALHGIRYGQSFCNRFGITDNHLYYNDYNNGSTEWADDYIRKTYVVK
jgi:hypothetical protein